MKNSIARQVTKKILITLIIALAVLFAGSFALVSQVVYLKNKTLARTVVTVYSDLAVYDAGECGEPIDVAHPNASIRQGNYVCKWYNVEYAYMYIPDFENNTLTYISIACKDKSRDDPTGKNFVGTTESKTLTKEEKDVWNGKETFANIITDNKFGHEFSTVLLVKDKFGNKILAGVDMDYKDTYSQIAKFFSILAVIIILVALWIYFAVYYIIKKKISKPAAAISEKMQSFISDGKQSKEKLSESGYAEYAMIANAFNCMTADIDKYIGDINSLTREQEHQKTELEIAAKIQRGFLPKEHLVNGEYEIRTFMAPAKNVGGDLYDYLPLDENRALIVIADVSGKGISAAIYMAILLMLIRQFAKMELSPDEILRQTNNTLSENNAAMLFATAFVGIYDSRTKTLTYANAGHNPPYIVGKEITELNKDSGLLLGLYSDEEYKSNTVKLDTSDILLLYTDGITEAADENKRFFGTERLIKALKSFKASKYENLVSFINERLKEFVNGAEQYDDITMLTLTVKDTTELLLSYDINEFPKIKAEILKLPIPRSEQLNYCLAAEECFVNICSYAFDTAVPEDEKIKFTLCVSDRIKIRFEDGGKQFNPLNETDIPEDYDLDTKIGGLGKFIAVSSVDDIKYKYENGKNILTLIKYFTGESENENTEIN